MAREVNGSNNNIKNITHTHNIHKHQHHKNFKIQCM